MVTLRYSTTACNVTGVSWVWVTVDSIDETLGFCNCRKMWTFSVPWVMIKNWMNHVSFSSDYGYIVSFVDWLHLENFGYIPIYLSWQYRVRSSYYASIFVIRKVLRKEENDIDWQYFASRVKNLLIIEKQSICLSTRFISMVFWMVSQSTGLIAYLPTSWEIVRLKNPYILWCQRNARWKVSSVGRSQKKIQIDWKWHKLQPMDQFTCNIQP